jgi:hypothetical protein
MTTWQMSSGPASIAIRTSIDLAHIHSDLYALRQLADGYDPTIEVEPEAGGSSEMTLDLTSGKVRLRGPASDLRAEDLLFLAYLVLESHLHLYGIVTLHGAAVERHGHAVLLLGHSGAGKTTTAVRLCHDHGFSLLGNDLVVTGGRDALLVHAGSLRVTLRYSSVAAATPKLLSLFLGTQDDLWRAKIDMPPEALGIQAGRRGSRLAAVIFVRSDPAYSQAIDLPGESLPHRLNLHENALRYIRGTSTPWLVGTGRTFGPYVPSLDNPAAHAARTRTLRLLLAMSRYVAGPPEEVARVIASKVPASRLMPCGGAK